MKNKVLATGLIALAVASGGAGLYFMHQKEARSIDETKLWLEAYKESAAKHDVKLSWGAISADGSTSHVADMKWEGKGAVMTAAAADFQGVVTKPDHHVSHIALLGLHDLAVSGAVGMKVQIKSTEVKEIDVAAMDALYQSAGKGLPTPPFQSIAMKDISGTDGKSEATKADSFNLDMTKTTDGYVKSLDMKLANLTVPKEARQNAQLDEPLKELGIETPTLTVQLGYKADYEGKTITLDPLFIDFSGKGDLKQTLTLGVDPKALAKGEAEAKAAFRTATLNAMMLTVSDHGLATAMMNAAAKQQGKTADDLRSEAKAHLKEMSDLGPTLAAAATAFEKFIDKPGQLVVTMKPQTPQLLSGLGMLAMMNPEKMASDLNLKVEAK